jgi:two-component system, chemotaxis family, chemotaxis protein CheY
MKSCLIVDDSKVIRKVARHILETLEFEVEEAGDGQEALTRCEQKMPDVVLLDWNMPVMSGMEFLRLLRQRGHATSPRSCSARPRTTWRISARRSKRAPTNM